MDITKLECFEYDSQKDFSVLIKKLYKDINYDFLFLFFKKTINLVDDISFEYSKNQFNALVCDHYFNKSRCSQKISDIVSKQKKLTLQLTSFFVDKNNINKATNKVFKSKYDFFSDYDYNFFFDYFNFLLNEKLKMKNNKMIQELTYWFLFQRGVDFNEYESYILNLKKRVHWESFMKELKLSYKKQYNEVIINLNNSINKTTL